MKHKIAIIGFGTVGQGLCEILLKKNAYLSEKYGFEWEVVAVADFAYGNVYNPNGLNIPAMLELAKSKQKFTDDLVNWDTLQLIRECNANIVCEVTYTDLNTGGPAVEHCRAALEAGKHVVTTNKGPVALFYQDFKKLADSKDVRFLIEGTVVAGTPIVNLTDGPLAGCEITKIRGILNGTTNYMLTEMEKGMSYDEVLKVAQELGYAEADPTGDVEGYDARGKVTILVNVVMGVPLKITEVPCQGITKITAEDIKFAREQGARWKLIGSIEKKSDGAVVASVAPEMVPLSHPLAGVMGATNALTFTTDLLGDVTVVGPGAGRIQTGFALLTDILAIAR